MQGGERRGSASPFSRILYTCTASYFPLSRSPYLFLCQCFLPQPVLFFTSCHIVSLDLRYTSALFRDALYVLLLFPYMCPMFMIPCCFAMHYVNHFCDNLNKAGGLLGWRCAVPKFIHILIFKLLCIYMRRVFNITCTFETKILRCLLHIRGIYIYFISGKY